MPIIASDKHIIPNDVYVEIEIRWTFSLNSLLKQHAQRLGVALGWLRR